MPLLHDFRRCCHLCCRWLLMRQRQRCAFELPLFHCFTLSFYYAAFLFYHLRCHDISSLSMLMMPFISDAADADIYFQRHYAISLTRLLIFAMHYAADYELRLPMPPFLMMPLLMLITSLFRAIMPLRYISRFLLSFFWCFLSPPLLPLFWLFHAAMMMFSCWCYGFSRCAFMRFLIPIFSRHWWCFSLTCHFDAELMAFCFFFRLPLLLFTGCFLLAACFFWADRFFCFHRYLLIIDYIFIYITIYWYCLLFTLTPCHTLRPRCFFFDFNSHLFILFLHFHYAIISPLYFCWFHFELDYCFIVYDDAATLLFHFIYDDVFSFFQFFALYYARCFIYDADAFFFHFLFLADDMRWLRYFRLRCCRLRLLIAYWYLRADYLRHDGCFYWWCHDAAMSYDAIADWYLRLFSDDVFRWYYDFIDAVDDLCLPFMPLSIRCWYFDDTLYAAALPMLLRFLSSITFAFASLLSPILFLMMLLSDFAAYAPAQRHFCHVLSLLLSLSMPLFHWFAYHFHWLLIFAWLLMLIYAIDYDYWLRHADADYADW